MAQKVPTAPCEVIILTTLPVEFRAVVAHLQETQEIIHPEGTIYRVGRFTGEAGQLQVAVAQVGMGGGSAAVETERAIHFFRPHLSLFVGIAGGLKDVQLGDVVAATKVYAYESGKAGQTFEPRPEVWRASYPLEQRARHEVSDEAWLTHLRGSLSDPAPHAYIGALAAGEKILASTQSAVYHQLKATYGDALAVEMEGHGFLQAVSVNQHTYGLVIRGISDLIDNKTAADAAGSQSRAARHAAAFSFRVLEKFAYTASDGSACFAVWNVPYRRNPHFTGREELLDQLNQQLSPEMQQNATPFRRAALTQPQAIKGLGGMGKTQIAIEYAYRSRDRDRYTHIFWINAASEETLCTSFVELAKLLPAFPLKDENNQQKLVAAIKAWLEQCQQRWLLIFDNADDVALVYGYLPQSGNGSVLLTTRADAVGSIATAIEVETMGFIEGTHLLLRRAQRFAQASDEEINQAGNIVVALDHFPLAIDQAGAYIEETKCSFTDYLTVYQEHRQTLLARRGLPATDYPNSVATTWDLSFQKVQQKNPAATELLQICAFLAPDEIPEELIQEGAAYWPPLLQQAAMDLLTFQQTIAELLKFSLLKRLTERRALSVHRLVQAVQRDQMEPPVQRKYAENVVRAVNRIFPNNPGEADFYLWGLRYLDQAQVCSTLIKQFSFSFPEAADLQYRTARHLGEIIFCNPSVEPLYRSASHIWEQLRVEHLDLASALHELASLYSYQRKYAEAVSLCRHALRLREDQLGANHLDVASSLSILARIYTHLGYHDQAERLFIRALRIQENQLGTDHPTVGALLEDLADLYCSQGKPSQAQPLYQRALRIEKPLSILPVERRVWMRLKLMSSPPPARGWKTILRPFQRRMFEIED